MLIRDGQIRLLQGDNDCGSLLSSEGGNFESKRKLRNYNKFPIYALKYAPWHFLIFIKLDSATTYMLLVDTLIDQK